MLTHSDDESKYRGVAYVVFESYWLRNLFIQLQYPITEATLVYFDNVSVVYLSSNPIKHHHKKNIGMNIQFVHEKILLLVRYKFLHVIK